MYEAQQQGQSIYRVAIVGADGKILALGARISYEAGASRIERAGRLTAVLLAPGDPLNRQPAIRSAT